MDFLYFYSQSSVEVNVKNFSKIMTRIWQDHDKNMARSCQKHGKILSKTWQDRDKNMART